MRDNESTARHIASESDEIHELKTRLAEAEETIRAIRHGEVDALLIAAMGDDDRVYTISSAERPYRLMIEQMQEGALMVSAGSGLVLYCNRYFAELVSRPMEQIIGHPLHPHCLPTSDVMLDALLTSTSGRRGEFELLSGDGRRIPVAMAVNPVEGFETPTYCVIVTDLTSQRDNEQLRRAEQALRAADRRKDEFLAMLGHELRNPLTPIRMAVEVIRSRAHDLECPDLHKGLEIIERQVAHMTRLVDDLLDVARITRGTVKLQCEVVNLADAVALAVDNIRPMVERHHHTLTVHWPSEPIHVYADPIRVAQVVTNLLHNAVKYTKEGGQIDLVISRRARQARILVRDTGMGISPDLLPHVFDLFTQAEVTLDRSQGGLGLGLTLVKRLVKMHGGIVRAASRGIGTGSEFTIMLPLVDDGRAAAEPRSVPAPRQRDIAKRILIVDDNEDAAEMLGMLLSSRGHEVAIAHDGISALEKVRAFKPDVLCLDIGLPHLDGYALAARIREIDLGKRPTLIAVTGYGQDKDRSKALESGFDHHLVKPVNIEALYQILLQS